MGLHLRHPRPRADRALDALGDLVRGAEVEVGGELQVQRDAGRPVLLEDRDVVGLLDQRLGQRDREHPVAQVEPAPARLDVHDDIAAGQRVLDGGLDQVGGRWPSTTACPGGTVTTTSAK